MENVAIGSMQDQRYAILEDIEWTVHPGDYWVVAGVQGSGKSDFLMMTGGVMPPSKGRYCLFGEEMPIFDDERLQVRLRLGLVFARGQLLNHLTVRENVALPLRYHKNLSEAEAEVTAMLEALELAPWADSTPGALAWNWQQRVGLARALMLRPELLLVDNPIGGLDVRHTLWWLDFFDQLSRGHELLARRPVTLVITSANLHPWKNRARQFAVLKDRRLVVLGSWDEFHSSKPELLSEVLPAST
jgi:ABC-type transporter Mla maintaining outer membrane lipid asymmetry ATPase subunit MlaF